MSPKGKIAPLQGFSRVFSVGRKEYFKHLAICSHCIIYTKWKWLSPPHPHRIENITLIMEKKKRYSGCESFNFYKHCYRSPPSVYSIFSIYPFRILFFFFFFPFYIICVGVGLHLSVRQAHAMPTEARRWQQIPGFWSFSCEPPCRN